LIVVDVNVLNYACPLLLGVQKLKKLCATLFAMFMASFAQSQELADLPLIDADGYQAGILRLPGNFLARDECAVGVFVICGPFSVQGLPADFRFYLAGASESAGAPGYGGQSVNTAADNQDHGNDRGSATSVGLSSTTEGQLHVGDNDYFRIDVTESVTIRMETTGNADTYGQFYDSAGNRIGSNDDDGANKNFRLTASLEAGTYYLLVGGYNDSTAGQYTLAVSGNLAGGKNFDTATKIGIPSHTRGELDSGERDFFRIDLPEAGNLRIQSTGGLDTYGILYDLAGNVIAENDDERDGPFQGDNFLIEVNVEAGTYYAEVRGFNNLSTGRYSLSVIGSWNISDSLLKVFKPADGSSPQRIIVEWPCSNSFIGADIEVPYLPGGYVDNYSIGSVSQSNFGLDAVAVMPGCRGRITSKVAEVYRPKYYFEFSVSDRFGFSNSIDGEGGSVEFATNISTSYFEWYPRGDRIRISDSGAIFFDNRNRNSGETILEVFPFRIREIVEEDSRRGEIISEGEITVRWLPRVK